MSMVIARRYAGALLNLAAREDAIAPVGEGLNALAETCNDAPALLHFMADPNVPGSSKRAALDEVLQGLEAPALVVNYARYVLAKRRIALIDEMRVAYHMLADERLGRAAAEVTTIREMDEPLQQRLREQLEKLSGKQVSLTVRVDESILGGVVARIGSTVWDGSLRSQLHQIRQQIIEG